MAELTTLLDGLHFPEGPRWHEGKLWFSDMHADKVMTVDMAGNAETVVDVPGNPSGLGWLPDGRLLIVSMIDRRLLRLDADGLHEVADLSALATFHCNDMVVDAQGRAYVGNFGFDLHGGADATEADIILVLPDGSARVVAPNMQFPNGTVITPDGRTLIVGETFAGCLTAFDIAPDGSLTNRRVWAKLEGAIPDGICLDAEGAIYVASPLGHQVLRVREGGEVADRIAVEHESFACMLGGPDGTTLFVATCKSSDPIECRAEATGRIEIAKVAVPRAGWP